ncbi:MAG: hypothetical protein M5U33_01620 [Pseudorhodoplanes sp.]|nr:hypothetical protein [Pseudorhodoplanes sp.]MCQ3941952.1 hypothetical protein [Alphaproteobacteria bacterium]MBW7949074.1 hypothetical protein [Pseudorhodoplanes sp.]MCL4712626.1 hypothetical protein [Pseudorhodoplanes sp.]MCZ7641694.1 hypothetical protein [Pseudorhodoplanes sp.]
MLKIIGKAATVAALAVVAVSFSTPSHAAKKKAAPAKCTAGAWQKSACVGLTRTGQRCGFDGKWYKSLVVYFDPSCAKK